jgi:hypothetical protein
MDVMGKIILGWMILGARASRVQFRASRPERRWTNQLVDGFSARRRKRQPGRSRSPDFWMIFQPLRSWLISGVPLGQVRTKFHEGEVRKIILGWTIGAIGV